MAGISVQREAAPNRRVRVIGEPVKDGAVNLVLHRHHATDGRVIVGRENGQHAQRHRGPTRNGLALNARTRTKFKYITTCIELALDNTCPGCLPDPKAGPLGTRRVSCAVPN